MPLDTCTHCALVWQVPLWMLLLLPPPLHLRLSSKTTSPRGLPIKVNSQPAYWRLIDFMCVYCKQGICLPLSAQQQEECQT